MRRLRALVVDDEPLSRRALRQLASHHTDLTIVGECRDGVEAIDALARLEVDVVFLDVRMPGASGLEVARVRGRCEMPLVVFVTAFDEFAVSAFDVGATDYLVKPLTQARFDLMMERLRGWMASRTADPCSAAPGACLVVSRHGNDLVLRAEEIECAVAENVHVLLHTRHGPIRLRTTLARLAHHFAPGLFLRVHRSFLVRVDQVRAMQRAESGRVLVLASGRRVPVGRRRHRAVTAALQRAHRAFGGHSGR